jgi:hypothetical protein
MTPGSQGEWSERSQGASATPGWRPSSVIEALVNIPVVPVPDRGALRLIVQFVGRLRVIDDNEVGAASRQGACQRERGTRSSVREEDLLGCVRKPHVREKSSVLRMGHQAPGEGVVIGREAAMARDAEDARSHRL